MVWVRGVMNPSSVAGRLLARAGEFTIVVSPDTLFELMDVLHRPELQRKLTRITGRPALDTLTELLASAERCHPADSPPVCRDPDDDKFFASALAGAVNYIVSEDKDVLAIAEYEGVRTITAAEFIALIDRR
jgi:putative PIN family toxin of toxin-antitoxin system